MGKRVRGWFVFVCFMAVSLASSMTAAKAEEQGAIEVPSLYRIEKQAKVYDGERWIERGSMELRLRGGYAQAFENTPEQFLQDLLGGHGKKRKEVSLKKLIRKGRPVRKPGDTLICMAKWHQVLGSEEESPAWVFEEIECEMLRFKTIDGELAEGEIE